MLRNVFNSLINGTKMKIYPIPCLQDNYAYLLVDESTHQAAAVDPVTPSEVIQAAKNLNVDLKMILTTHHHWDHASGNLRFTEKCPVPVFGGDERIEALSNKVQDGDILKLGNIQIQAIETPCHTRGSISYYCSMGEHSALFSGDTLFIAGCGRFFEGDASTMLKSLSKLSKLPTTTEVYCGHEYTAKDLKVKINDEAGEKKRKKKERGNAT
ncbi:hypothetical protein HMI56_000178 [Coelomomyces lativittatus]|nr:hypothetical protein HMI56_000178 [Coelomomyces lativittatus]